MKSNSISVASTKYMAHIVALALLVLAAVILLLFGRFYAPQSDFAIENGQLDLSGYHRWDKRLIYLNGAWEYYPGQLIISEPTEGLPRAEFMKLPMRALSGGSRMPENGKASFRIVLTNIQPDFILSLSVPAYLGDYRIYLDGVLCDEPIEQRSPNFFQFSPIWGEDGATRELVLEISQSNFYGFDKCPVLSDTDLQFNTYFSDRIVFLIFFGMMLFAYVIIPFLLKFYREKHLRYFALSGCIALVAFVLETLWYYGIIGYVQEIVPAKILFLLRLAVEMLLFLALYYTQMHANRENAFQRRRSWWIVFAVALFVVPLVSVAFLPRQTALLIFFLCAGAVATITIVLAMKGVQEQGRRAFVSAVGTVSAFTGFLFNDLSINAGATFAYQMVLPACLLISLICWSLMIADNHKHHIALMEKALTAEQATARTQAAFLASQIQPHFLYNTLTTIQELCYTDPAQAADTVVRFSSYLRKNIDFMEYKDKILFTEELSHIENYIDIQRARFGDAIEFVRRIEVDQFMLPPLTVQPLIENAISHGIRKHNGHGTVTLTVQHINREILITVTDDGEGFDVETVHSRSLENIRCRIEGAMHGTVRIDSNPGKGTTVVLRFPEKEALVYADHHC